MTIQVLDFLMSVAGTMLLAALWFFLWRPLAVAHLRQDVIDTRDILFDLVADRKTTLGFDSPVYQGTRNDLNAMIRFAHRISITTALLADLFIREERRKYRAQTVALRKNLTDEDRRVISLIDREQSWALLRFLMCSSPLMWVATMCVLAYGVFSMIRGGVRVCRKILKDILFVPAIERVEFQSGQKYLFGNSDLEAQPG